jgi:hypothetical protein
MNTPRRIILACLLASALVPSALPSADPLAPGPSAPNVSGLHDFDFLIGDWRVHHTRLKVWLAGCRDWFEFDGTSSLRPTMGGWGNVDDNVVCAPAGTYRAMSIRAYDPATGQWAIWWLDGRNPFGDLDPPVKGGFRDGVGTFYGDDTFGGRPIRVRYVWSRITPTSARWEQAFSRDGGKTWETNWTSDFTRVH